MRAWKAYCTHAEKDKLGQFLHEILLYGAMLRQRKNHTEASVANAYRRSKEEAYRETPKFIVTDTRDDEGNYIIVDGETGEITPFVAVGHTTRGVTNWTAAIYTDEPQKPKEKEAFREESLF